MGSSEVPLLQMQPHFFAHLEVVWQLMLIMPLLILSIGSIKYVKNHLVGVLNLLNKFFLIGSFRLDMS